MNAQPFRARLSTLAPSRREGLSAIFHKAQERVLPTATGWLNPEKSVGDYIGKAKWDYISGHIWEAKGPARDALISVSPKIREYLDNAVEPISRIVTWSMYMVGRDPRFASPSIIFFCEVRAYRRDVRNIIRESGILNCYPGIKTGHLPRPPDLGHMPLVPLGAGGPQLYNSSDMIGDMMALTSQGKSACGSQIFVDANGTNSVSLSAAATIGGVIRLGGKCYYTTAAHALSSTPNSENEDMLPNFEHDIDDDALSLDGDEDVYSGLATDLTTEDIRPCQPSHGSNDHLYDHRSLKDDIRRQWSLERGHDAQEPLSSPEPPRKLSLNPIGRPFMTSMDVETGEAGLDYALIEMSSKNHIVENVIRFGPKDKNVVKVQSIAQPEPQDADVVAVTPRGTIHGWISGTPFYSCAPGRRSYMKVKLDGPLYKGDCGTWVVDATNGNLFGHVVLGSPGSGTALIIPFADVFDDILFRFGESPTFPTAMDNKLSSKSAETIASIIRKTISSAGESSGSPERHGIAGKGILNSPMGHESQSGEISDFLRAKELWKKALKQVISEMEGDTKELNDFGIDNATIPSTHPAQQETASQPDPDTSDWVNDLSNGPGRLDVQKRIHPFLQQNKIRASSVVGVGVKSNLLEDAADDRSPGNFAQSSRPQSDIPMHNEPLNPSTSPKRPKIQDVLFTFCKARMQWENIELLDNALKEFDLKTIYENAEEEHEQFISRARSKGDDTKLEWGYQDCVVRALSRYFGKSFFTRIQNPICENCPSKLPTTPRGKAEPTPKERAGRAPVVELYQCAEEHCQAYTRFPRYWDVRTLLLNPRGRAGESSNCFGLLCRALGSRVRWVWNAEDTMWTEVYSEHQGRWIHVDASEGAWDDPLLYTETMGKKLSYCIAFSSDGATDVTRRYVRSPRHALARTRCSESELLRIIHDIRSKRRMNMSKEDIDRLEKEDLAEAQELESYIFPSEAMDKAQPEEGQLNGTKSER